LILQVGLLLDHTVLDQLDLIRDTHYLVTYSVPSLGLQLPELTLLLVEVSLGASDGRAFKRRLVYL